MLASPLVMIAITAIIMIVIIIITIIITITIIAIAIEIGRKWTRALVESTILSHSILFDSVQFFAVRELA